MFTARRTAELIKYAANAFLATKITFINEIADLSEKVGADVQDVARGIGLDNRIGSKFLHAGPGFGGSCFPKDTRALVKIAHDHDVPLRIVEAVLGVNDNRKRAMARKVANALGGDCAARPSPCSASPSSRIPTTCARRRRSRWSPGCSTWAPKSAPLIRSAWSRPKRELPDITYCDDAYACAQGADALVIVTEWVQIPRARPGPAEDARWRSRSWSICATSTAPRKWPRLALPTKAWGGRPSRGGEVSVVVIPRGSGVSSLRRLD